MNDDPSQHIKHQASHNKYFHMMLNIADEDLDPFEYRLLGHYIRKGVCTEAIGTTAQKCKMSVAKVRSTRIDLETKGYIKIDPVPGKGTRILILDRMAENVRRCTPTKNVRGKVKDTPSENDSTPLPKTSGVPLSDSSPKEEHIQEPLKKNNSVVSNETTVPPSISVPDTPKDEKPKEEPAPEKPVEPSPPSEEKNSEPPGSDAPPMHIAIIDAYWAGIPDDLRPIGKPPYSRHCRVAAELRDAGMTPERVTKFMAAKYPGYRAWCVGHNMPPVMPLEFVKKYIRAWITEDEKKSVAGQVEEFMIDWCEKCDRPKLYCVCGKEKPKPVESVVTTCWEHARGILTVILPSAHRKLLSQIKPVEKRGDALVLEVSNPVFRDQLEMTLASKQFTDPIRLLSGGELTNFRVVVA